MAIATPMFRGADLAAELRDLRKGRGVQFGQPVTRIGPTLRTLCALSDDDTPHQTMSKVTDWLRDMIAYLPADLRISAVAAYGLHDEVRLRFYQDRVGWLAQRLNRNARTARRRIDAAIEHLAALAVRGGHRVAGLRQFVDQPVELAFALCGITENEELVWQCRVVAVARHVDDRDRHFAVVTALDEPEATIAIPTTRIRRVVPIKSRVRCQSVRGQQ